MIEEEGDEFSYVTDADKTVLIAQAIQQIQQEQLFLHWFERYAPLVAKGLIEAGVKFPDRGTEK